MTSAVDERKAALCVWKDRGRLEAIMVEYPQLLHTGIDTTDARALAEFYRNSWNSRSTPS